jgi:hypothetical protein
VEVPREIWTDMGLFGSMKLDISVQNPGGTSAFKADILTIKDGAQSVPKIDSVGLATAGCVASDSVLLDDDAETEICLNGENFDPNTSWVHLRPNEVLAVNTAASSTTQLRAWVPRGLPLGYRNVTVVNTDGLKAVRYAGLISIVDDTTGAIDVTAYDAFDGLILDGTVPKPLAAVSSQGTLNSVNLVHMGSALFEHDTADYGPNTVTTTATGYYDDVSYVFVEPGQRPHTVTQATAALLPSSASNDYTIVLTWEDVVSVDHTGTKTVEQLDLDLALFMNDGTSCNKANPLKGITTPTDFGYADVKHATTGVGNGPETVSYDTSYAGQGDIISVWATNASADADPTAPDIGRSRARIKVYKRDGATQELISSLLVPISPIGLGAWHAIDIDTATGMLREVSVLDAKPTTETTGDTGGCVERICTFAMRRQINPVTFETVTNSLNYNMFAHSETLMVTNEEDCRWQASDDCTWITLTSASAQGNGFITFNVAANETGADRSGHIYLGDKIVTVTQSASIFTPDSPTVDLGVPSGSGGSGGGSGCMMRASAGFGLDTLLCLLIASSTWFIRWR